MPKNLNYWYYSKGNNFGDVLSPVILNYMVKDNYNLKLVKKTDNNKLLAVGSILRKLTKYNIVWGSGAILNNEIIAPKGCVFLAVRGPLTRKLIKNADVPEIYGDPAILMPEIYTPNKVNYDSKVLVLPHYVDFDLMSFKNDKIKKLNIKRLWTRIIDYINASDIVITSSLHGIIVSEAYNKKVIWIKSPSEKIIGGDFKFQDYFQSTNRKNVKAIKWNEIKNMIDSEKDLSNYILPDDFIIDKKNIKEAWRRYYG